MQNRPSSSISAVDWMAIANCEALVAAVGAQVSQLEIQLLMHTFEASHESPETEHEDCSEVTDSLDTLAQACASAGWMYASDAALPISARAANGPAWDVESGPFQLACDRIDAALSRVASIISDGSQPTFGIEAGQVAEDVALELDALEAALDVMERHVGALETEVRATAILAKTV